MGSCFKIALTLIIVFSFVSSYFFFGTYQYDRCAYLLSKIPMYICTLLLALKNTFVFLAPVLAFNVFFMAGLTALYKDFQEDMILFL